MTPPIILLIMLRTEQTRIGIGKVKWQTNTMTKNTFVKIQGHTKSPQKLNFKNIGQYLIIQVFFHQLQGLFQKSKKCWVMHIILKTSVCQGNDIRSIAELENILIDLLKRLNLMKILYITQAIVIDFRYKICHRQRLNSRYQLRF
ncbi:Uncharacterised protein [Chlamydia trachomatis]|nr:Uncharacterised protein [Chlamydia trachomatis]